MTASAQNHKPEAEIKQLKSEQVAFLFVACGRKERSEMNTRARPRQSLVCAAVVASIGFAAVLVMAQDAGQQASAAEREKRRQESARLVYESLDLSLYRMEINPVTPDTGITTGIVIAYGHPLRPPYQVVAKDSFVFVNGVQIYPGLRSPAMVQREQRQRDSLRSLPRELLAPQESVRAVLRQAHRLYDSVCPAVGHRSALESTAAFLRASRYVDSLPRVGEYELEVYLAGSSASLVMYFRPKQGMPRDSAGRSTPDEFSEMTPVELAELTAKLTTDALRRGSIEVVGPTFEANIWRSDLERIRRVLGSDGLDERGKFVKLWNTVPRPEWFIANYDAAEWRAIER